MNKKVFSSNTTKFEIIIDDYINTTMANSTDYGDYNLIMLMHLISPAYISILVIWLMQFVIIKSSLKRMMPINNISLYLFSVIDATLTK